MDTDIYKRNVILDKYTLTSEELQEMINLIIASNKIKKIILPQGEFKRTSIHCILYGKIGVGKSTILNTICENLDLTPIISLTKATFLGSVDKTTGIPIEPEIWKSRNTILPIDEFTYDSQNRSDKSVLESLLITLEYPHIKKGIGYRCNDTEIIDDDLYLKIKNNTIEVKTRFSLFMTTMFSPSSFKSLQMRALVSRCIVLPYNPSIELIFNMIYNKNNYEFKDLNVESIVHINEKDVNYIINYLKQYIKESKLSSDLILRTYGDLIRIFAVLKKHRTDIYDKIITYKKIF